MIKTETMTVAMMPVDCLIPYARNPRKNDSAVDAVAASIKEFGFRQPVVVDDDMVILVGHTRVKAAKKLGMIEVPVHVATGLTETQKKAYRIADNRLNEIAEWDDDLLALELEDLRMEDFDLGTDALGFDDGEIDGLLASLDATPEGNTDPDEVPEPPAVPVTKLGDVWLLGRHRLMCGDSTDADCVARLMAGGKAHLMVTDPPYGVEYDPTRTSDNPLKAGKVLNDDRADWREAWALFPGDVAYVWHASMFTHVVLESLEACGFEHRSMIIWGKDRFTIGRGHYHWQHEPAWYVVRKGATGHWNGDRSKSTLWSIAAREDGGHGHGTQKPIECMRRPIENNSAPGDAVYEPFSGSGTTIIAAEQTGRRCFAMELSPQYVDVAVRRWEQFTGKKAALESTGEPFPS